jgi:hypothetical protein
MVHLRKLFVAEKGGELLEVGKIASQGVWRNVSLISEVVEKIKNVLSHEDTLA